MANIQFPVVACDGLGAYVQYIPRDFLELTNIATFTRSLVVFWLQSGNTDDCAALIATRLKSLHSS